MTLKLTAPLTILWEDREWIYDPDMIDVKRGAMIEAYCGAPLMVWEQRCWQCDTKALTALLWELKKQAGESTPPMSAMNFSPVAFHRAYLAAMTAEAERIKAEREAAAEDDEDPTGTTEAGT